MAPLLGSALAAIAPKVGDIIDRFLPEDPKKAAEMRLEVLKLADGRESRELDATLQVALGQMRINEKEAEHPTFFRGGWRPAVGWACVAALVYTYLIRPIVPWVVTVTTGVEVPEMPALNTAELLGVLSGLLGLGTLRTYERVQGKA
jgi:hypothetical protein